MLLLTRRKNINKIIIKKGRVEERETFLLLPFFSFKNNYMDSTRQQKIARLLQKELSTIFQLQTKSLHGVLISVSRCRISPDLSICSVYLSIFPSKNTKEILEAIEANKKSIRFDLGQKVRHQLRIIPDLRFFIDDSLDYIDHIDELLKKPANEEQDNKNNSEE